MMRWIGDLGGGFDLSQREDISRPRSSVGDLFRKESLVINLHEIERDRSKRREILAPRREEMTANDRKNGEKTRKVDTLLRRWGGILFFFF